MSEGGEASGPDGKTPPSDHRRVRRPDARLVLGWFDDLDAAMFRAIDQVHRAIGVEGDLLEIGAYLGKSAILLGYLVRPQEHLVVCDLFTNEAMDPDLEADARSTGQSAMLRSSRTTLGFTVGPPR